MRRSLCSNFLSWSTAAVLFLPTFTVSAAQPLIEAMPTTVEGRLVSRADPVHVYLRLKAGSVDLSDVTVSSISNDGLAVAIEDDAASPGSERVAANTERLWKLRLMPATGDTLPPATLQAHIAVAFKQGDPEQRHYLLQTIKITAPAADTSPSLEVNPSTIDGRTVSKAEPVFVEVRLKAGSQELTDIGLSTFSSDPLTVTVEGDAAKPGRLDANAEQAWMLRLEPSKGTTLAPGAVGATVSVAFMRGREVRRRQYLYQTIKIPAASSVAVPALVEVDIKGSLQALSHERAPGQLFVVVTNKHSQALRVSDIRITAPLFVDTVGPGAKELQHSPIGELAYGDTKVFSYGVKAKDQIIPGKYPVVVTVVAQAPSGLSGAVTKTQDVELAVLGEADVLGKIGAPSLLFLPGVLFLLAWQLMWTFGKDANARQNYPLPPTTGTFWVVAVAISIVAALLYPLAVLKLWHQKRDYVTAYGVLDFIYVFALAILSAVVLYLLWIATRWIWTRLSTPSENDSPAAILTKLALRGWNIRLRQVGPADAAVPAALVLEPWSDQTTLWIAPPAQLTANAGTPPHVGNYVQSVTNGEIPQAHRLALRIWWGLWNEWWTLTWQAAGQVTGPTRVTANEWPARAGQQRLIQA